MFAPLYDRGGTYVLWLCIAAGTIMSVLITALTAVWTVRYLGLGSADLAAGLAVGVPLLLLTLAASVWRTRDELRFALSWSQDEPPTAQAADIWRVVVELPLLATRRTVAAGSLSVPVLAALIAWVTDQPAWSVLPITGAYYVTMLAAAALWSSMAELAGRPIVEDIARHLPPDFEPPPGPRLRTKALAPLPAVTLFSALTCGAFVDAVDKGAGRLALAIGLALVTVVPAAVVYLAVTQSSLGPLDDLLDATRRVRGGDLETTVPIVTADDLGQLAHSFNEMLEGLGEREALRDDKAQLTSALRASLARVVAAADDERRRVERDLHDGAQQHLVLARLRVNATERLVADEPGAAAAAFEELRNDLDRALQELRDLAHGIYPAVLESDGVGPALREAAQRMAIPATVSGDEDDGRPPREVEAAVYFCCLEALQNTAKHAGTGARVTIALVAQDGVLRFTLADDGRGFDPATCSGSAGLQNMADRIGALGGTLTVDSQPGRGTRVTGEVPVTHA